MRAHGHRHADRTQHHGHQADQAEQPGGALQAIGQRGVAFSEVGDLRIRQHLLQAGTHGGDASAVRRQLEQEALSGAAALLQQAALLERALGHHHPRTQPHARAHAVRLAHQDRRDAEVGVANLQARSHLGVQPYEHVFGNHHGGVGQHLAQISRGLQIDGSVEGILLRIDRLQRNQQRHRIARGGDHGNRIGNLGALNAMRGHRIECLLLLGSGLANMRAERSAAMMVRASPSSVF